MKGRQRRNQKKQVSKKKKFVKDGVFYAELNDFLAAELAEKTSVSKKGKDAKAEKTTKEPAAGYTGCEVRVTPQNTEVVIRALESSAVVGSNHKRARELTALIQQRFKFKEGALAVVADRQRDRSLSALAQAESVKSRLLEGESVRRACYAVIKFIKDNKANGCEVIVSGKLRGQRAKSMKFREGYMIHAGDAVNQYIDVAVKHVHLPQGVLGIKVKIMLPHDETGRNGVAKEQPDKVKVMDPKDLGPSYQPPPPAWVAEPEPEEPEQPEADYQPSPEAQPEFQQPPDYQQGYPQDAIAGQGMPPQGGMPPQQGGMPMPQQQFDQFQDPRGAPQGGYPAYGQQAPAQPQYQPPHMRGDYQVQPQAPQHPQHPQHPHQPQHQGHPQDQQAFAQQYPQYPQGGQQPPPQQFDQYQGRGYQ